MNKRIRLIVAVLLVIGAMTFLLVNGMQQGVGRILTIEEALAQELHKDIAFIQMEGEVDYTTVKYEPLKPRLIFDITDGVNKITVLFNDVKPDNFDSGYPIIVEGSFQQNGIFKADKLLIKCPSKYEEAVN